jgi:membrane protease YdiL (CAAX protease family)
MKQNWFYKKTSIKKLWVGAIVILLLTVLAEVVIAKHPHFTVEALFGFYALFGFISCVVMVIFAKILGFLIKRKDDYYDM